MPISKEQALEIIRRLSSGGSLESLAARLAPTPESVVELPPDVPRRRDAGASGRDARLAFLAARGITVPHLAGQGRSW